MTTAPSRIMILLLVLTGLCAGCLSTHPGSTSLAYVVVEGASQDMIIQAAKNVFGEDSYAVEKEEPGKLVFEREATQRDRTLWKNFGDDALRMRVVVTFEPFADDDILVRADAYALHKDAWDEDAQKVMRIARHPYQDLLNRIKDTVNE